MICINSHDWDVLGSNVVSLFIKTCTKNQEKHVFFWVEDVFPVGHAPFWCEVPGFQKDISTWGLTWNFILPLPQVGDPIGGHWGTRFCRLQSRGMEIYGNGKNCFRFCIFEHISVHKMFFPVYSRKWLFQDWMVCTISEFVQWPKCWFAMRLGNQRAWRRQRSFKYMCILGEVRPINNLIHSFSYFNLVNKYKFSQNLWWIFITRFADVCCFGVNIGVPWFWHVLTIQEASERLYAAARKIESKKKAGRAAVHGWQGYQPLSCAIPASSQIQWLTFCNIS